MAGFGADVALPISDIATFVSTRKPKNVFMTTASSSNAATHSRLAALVSQMAGSHIQYSVTQQLNSQRCIKSTSEQAAIRKAAAVAAEAFNDVMKLRAPNGVPLSERHLHARFQYAVALNDDCGLSYEPVVAGGDRALTLHYVRNNQPIRAGELVLMDAGANWRGYLSDISRTWPVSGRFSAAQRDVYEAVLEVQVDAIKRCTQSSGLTDTDLNRLAMRDMQQQVQRLGLNPSKTHQVRVLP